MTELDCSCIHGPTVQFVTLRNVNTKRSITVCLDALQASARLKAAAKDRRGHSMLAEYAREYDWGVWRSDHVVYLIPPLSPFDVRPSHHDLSAVPTVAEAVDT